MRWQFIPAGPWILPIQWLHVWWTQTSGDEDGLVSARSGKGLKAAILKMLDFPGAQFVGKIAIGQIVSRALDAGFTGEALPLGLIKQLKTNGFCAGLKGFAVESLQQNSQVFGSIAGVLLAHIVAPIYAAEGKGEEAASLAGGTMLGLGAAIAVPGGAAIAVGLLAPFVIKKIFDIVPKPEEIRAKYR